MLSELKLYLSFKEDNKQKNCFTTVRWNPVVRTSDLLLANSMGVQLYWLPVDLMTGRIEIKSLTMISLQSTVNV
jgi:hypothetical protein